MAKAKEIEVLVIEPGTAPRPARVQNTMEAFEEIVGGPVEIGYMPSLRVVVFYNGGENSREWSDPSRPRAEFGKTPLHSVAGTFLLCGCKNDRYTSLSASQEVMFQRRFTQMAERRAVPHGV